MKLTVQEIKRALSERIHQPNFPLAELISRKTSKPEDTSLRDLLKNPEIAKEVIAALDEFVKSNPENHLLEAVQKIINLFPETLPIKQQATLTDITSAIQQTFEASDKTTQEEELRKLDDDDFVSEKVKAFLRGDAGAEMPDCFQGGSKYEVFDHSYGGGPPTNRALELIKSNYPLLTAKAIKTHKPTM